MVRPMRTSERVQPLGVLLMHFSGLERALLFQLIVLFFSAHNFQPNIYILYFLNFLYYNFQLFLKEEINGKGVGAKIMIIFMLSLN